MLSFTFKKRRRNVQNSNELHLKKELFKEEDKKLQVL